MASFVGLNQLADTSRQNILSDDPKNEFYNAPVTSKTADDSQSTLVPQGQFEAVTIQATQKKRFYNRANSIAAKINLNYSTSNREKSFGRVIEQYFEAEFLDEQENSDKQIWGDSEDQDNIPDEFQTGIIQCKNKTCLSILQGFWMQGDYLAFVTYDVIKNTINLEVFRFKLNEIKSISSHVLFNRKKADSWNAVVDKDRKFINVFLYRNLEDEPANRKVEAYFINIQTLIQNPEAQFFTVVEMKDLIDNCAGKYLMEINQVIRETEIRNEVEILVVLTTYKEKKFTKGNASIQKTVFNIKISNVHNFNLPNQTCELVLNQNDSLDIVGLFVQRDHTSLMVFDNAEALTIDKSQSERTQIRFPYERVKTAQLTLTNRPRLLLQSAEKEIVVYEQSKGKWELLFEIPDFAFNMLKAVESFIIADHPESFQVKLFETKNDLTNPVVTTVDISNSFRAKELDSSSIEQMSLLTYNKFGRHFDFSKMNQGRAVFHSAHNYIDQVCGSYLISFKKNFSKAYLSDDYLKNISNPFRKAIPLKLPKMRISIDYIALQMSAGSKFLIAIITPNFEQRILKPEPQYLFMISLETYEVRQLNCPQIPVRNIIPVSGDRFFVQDVQSIAECKIIEDKDGFSLKRHANGSQFNLGTTIVSLAGCIEQQDTDYLILVKDKYFMSNHDKQIYVVDKKSNGSNDANIEPLLAKHTYTLLTCPKNSTQDIFSPISQQRISACFDSSSKSIYAIVASQDFALLYKIQINSSKLQESLNTLCTFMQILPIRKASEITIVNSYQLAIFSQIDLIVVNHTIETPESELTRSKVRISELDFKIKFQNPIQTVGIGSGVMIIDYGPRSLLINVGNPADSSPKSQEQIQHERIKTFNQISATFKRCLQSFGLNGYISLCEDRGDWNDEIKYTPIDVHSADLLTLDELDNQSFDETVLAQHLYLNKFTIWEGMIRDAIAERAIEITIHQLPRIFRPVLGDHSCSLIHHLSSNNLELLSEILEMPGIDQYYSSSSVKSPIFFNFMGLTPMSIAMKNRDYPSFYCLIEFLLQHQNNILNSYLVKDFLIKAIEKNLEVNNLLSSNLCICRLSRINVEHMGRFPLFYSDDERSVVNYESSQMELLHDEDAYDHMFGDSYPFQEPESLARSTRNNQVHGKVQNGGKNKQKPIEYFALTYPIDYDANNLEANQEKVSNMLEILAGSEHINLFSLPYIQRFIDFQWDSQLRNAYAIVFGLQLSMFTLILTAAAFTNYDDPIIGDKARVIIMCFNAVLTLITIGVFELRQLLTQGLNYFQSFWNFNDMIVFVLALVLAAFEIHFVVFVEKEFSNDETFDSKGRLLARKRLSENAEITVVTDNGPEQIDVDPWNLQVIRVLYAFLILTSFFKILQVAQIYPSIGFLIEMFSVIAERSVPFLSFFIYLNITFAFIFYVLAITFDETRSKDPDGEYQGIDQIWFIPFMMYTFRNSLGDFKTDTFLFLPPIQLYACWLMWLAIVLINVMILLNFLIVTIEGAYEDLHDFQIESAYQKKAAILKDLDDVFGKYIDTRAVNILVVRQGVENEEKQERDENIETLKKQVAVQKELLSEKMHEISNDMARMSTRVDNQLEVALGEIQALKSLVLQVVLQGQEVTLPKEE